MPQLKVSQLLEGGLRHFALGELELAKASWKQALALAPDNEQALEYLRLVASVATGPIEPTPPEPAPMPPLAEGDDLPPLADSPSEPPADPWAEPAKPAADWFAEPRSAGPTGWSTTPAKSELQLDASEDDAFGLISNDPPSRVPAIPAARPREPRSKQAEADTLMEGARELFGLGDFSGSLELAQKALAVDPNHDEALSYLERNEDTLIQMYESKLGSLEHRPRVILRADEIVWLNLDHRAGFVLSQIDGTLTIDDLYSLSGLSRLDTAKILAELVEQGVIGT